MDITFDGPVINLTMSYIATFLVSVVLLLIVFMLYLAMGICELFRIDATNTIPTVDAYRLLKSSIGDLDNSIALENAKSTKKSDMFYYYAVYDFDLEIAYIVK